MESIETDKAADATSEAESAADVDPGGVTAETEESPSGKISRRRAIAIGGAAAMAAIGLIAGGTALYRALNQERGSLLDCEIASRPADRGVAFSCPVDDSGGLDAAGTTKTIVNPAASNLPSLRQEEDPDDVPALYANVSFSGLETSVPYLVAVNLDKLSLEEVDKTAYPEGWRFAKEEGERAYEATSAETVASYARVLVPSARDGKVSFRLTYPSSCNDGVLKGRPCLQRLTSL